ncbi:MAG: hypothetical protein PHI45_02630 [Candidatus Pacebacteria bacterium]|nr:hypothetical protein [Candidatus Paceibacterota bacterium]
MDYISYIIIAIGIGLATWMAIQQKPWWKLTKEEKKKRLPIVIARLVLMVLGLVMFVFFYQLSAPQRNVDSDNFKKQPVENLITNSFGNDQIEKAIIRYLLTEKYFSWRNRDDSHVFCVIENLKPDQELFPLYIWAYCGEYIIQDNGLKTISGFSGPAKINYPNELSYYDLSKFSYEVPGDGADYTKDVKKKFPEDVQQKIFNHDAGDLVERAENYAFINISNWNLIKQAVADCKIKSTMQTHSLEVTATFKDGKTITAQEPGIDDIFDIINQYKDKCGEIIMGTE